MDLGLSDKVAVITGGRIKGAMKLPSSSARPRKLPRTRP